MHKILSKKNTQKINVQFKFIFDVSGTQNESKFHIDFYVHITLLFFQGMKKYIYIFFSACKFSEIKMLCEINKQPMVLASLEQCQLHVIRIGYLSG